MDRIAPPVPLPKNERNEPRDPIAEALSPADAHADIAPPACAADTGSDCGSQTGSMLQGVRVAVVGLGYVGLRVAVAMADRFPTVGFDVDETRLSTLRNGLDCTGEVEPGVLARSSLSLQSDPATLAESSFFIVAVPTPLTPGGKPDLAILEQACATIGAVMPRGATVVIESTVYPGTTERICGPALERASGL